MKSLMINAKGLAIFVILCAAAAWLAFSEGFDTSVNSTQPPPRGTQRLDIHNVPAAMPASTVPSASARAPAGSVPGPNSLRTRVLALSQSTAPEDRFAAYKLAEACAAAREKYVRSGDPTAPHELSLNPDAAREAGLCGDISTAEILQRYQWLEFAAAAGVRGAAQAFINSGPSGAGYSAIRDPIWESKVNDYLSAAARNKDVYALLTMSDRHESGAPELRDPLISLAYYQLAMEASLEQNGKPLPREEDVERRLRGALTQEQLAQLPTVKINLLRKGK